MVFVKVVKFPDLKTKQLCRKHQEHNISQDVIKKFRVQGNK